MESSSSSSVKLHHPPIRGAAEQASPAAESNPFAADATKSKRRRRFWPQFGLRTIMMMIILTAILSAWWRDRSQLLERLEQYENPPAAIASWSIEQVLGAPDTMGYGDIPTAWASSTPDSQKEWLELTYGVTLTPKQILIYETYNPGAVYRVTGFDSNGVERLLWQGKDPKKPGSGAGISRIIPKYRLRTNRIKVYIDSPKVAGWNEIDAVGVKDRFGKIYYAEKAKASSTYGVSRLIFTRAAPTIKGSVTPKLFVPLRGGMTPNPTPQSMGNPYQFVPQSTGNPYQFVPKSTGNPNAAPSGMYGDPFGK